MKLIKIHRILKFRQSNWVKEYIEFNTQKRTEAKDKFSENFFKLLINSIYGKTMENIRKRINVKLINNSKDYLRCVSKTNFVSQKISSKNFITVHRIKSLNKPIYVGFCILELSKLLMYQFHYKYVKNKFDADTDSLVYEIKSEDVYEECFKDKILFDFNEYPVDLKLYDSMNKKVLGKMKDEFKGQIITEYFGLKSKMYYWPVLITKKLVKQKE